VRSVDGTSERFRYRLKASERSATTSGSHLIDGVRIGTLALLPT